MKILIRNGRVIDPGNGQDRGRDEVADIAIASGRIVGIGQQLHDVARAFEFAKQRDPVDRCASGAVALRTLFVGQHLAPTPGRIDGAE